jgi:nucleoside-diphosphate-sugar epimerase
MDVMSGEVYNIGHDSMNYSKKNVCEIIKKLLPKTYFNYADVDGDPDKRNYVVSYEKINSLGFNTTISLEEGVKELIKSFPMIRIKSNYHNVFQK